MGRGPIAVDERSQSSIVDKMSTTETAGVAGRPSFAPFTSPIPVAIGAVQSRASVPRPGARETTRTAPLLPLDRIRAPPAPDA